MTATLFLAFVLFVAVIVMAIGARYLPGRTTATLVAGLPLWLLYVGTLAYFGVVRNPTLRPPGIVYVVFPVVLFVLLFFARSAAGARVATALPLWVILCLQSFRLGVELFLHQLWIDGLVPRMLTYEGGNVDIFIGLSAPLIAWVSTRGRGGERLALLWNILGLFALTNVVTRSALTAPGPLHLIASEVPNLAIGMFPFTYIAGFFAPLAISLHFLSIRALRAKSRMARGLALTIAA